MPAGWGRERLECTDQTARIATERLFGDEDRDGERLAGLVVAAILHLHGEGYRSGGSGTRHGAGEDAGGGESQTRGQLSIGDGPGIALAGAAGRGHCGRGICRPGSRPRQGERQEGVLYFFHQIPLVARVTRRPWGVALGVGDDPLVTCRLAC